ncbi:MAG: hypothetical protein AAB336_13415 [Acidobacteriota bacterium]
MNNDNLQNETEFRRFLLGGMTEDERIEFEGNFILDESLFENLRIAEDELIEQYLGGTLSDTEKSNFEANYLTTKLRRERVEFTRQMLAKFKLQNVAVAEVKKTASVAENPSFLESLIAFFKQPGFAFGTAFALLLLGFGGWFLLRNPNQPIDIAQNTPTPTPQVLVSPTPLVSENKNTEPSNTGVNQPSQLTNKNTESANQRPKVEANSNKKPAENVTQEKPTPTPSNSLITTLALFTGGVRSDGKTNELNLPKNSGGANLELNLESQDYKTYRAEIVDQNGKVIYRSGKLTAKNSKINAFVSAKNLTKGDFIVKVYGKNAKNEDESVADYQFRVSQK